MNFNQNINITTKHKTTWATCTHLIGIYLRLRDRYRDTILLESAGNQNTDNNYSFICVNAISGIEIKSLTEIEVKFPNQALENTNWEVRNLHRFYREFSNCFVPEKSEHPLANLAQGLYGYTSYMMLFNSSILSNSSKLLRKPIFH